MHDFIRHAHLRWFGKVCQSRRVCRGREIAVLQRDGINAGVEIEETRGAVERGGNLVERRRELRPKRRRARKSLDQARNNGWGEGRLGSTLAKGEELRNGISQLKSANTYAVMRC